jgi:hypothetical protein
VVQACNVRTHEAELRGSEVQNQSGLYRVILSLVKIPGFDAQFAPCWMILDNLFKNLSASVFPSLK